MKTSNTRVKQYMSPYDQSRIDAAKKKSDLRVVSRAIADKARDDSIKAASEYKKGLVDAEKSLMDLDKSLMDFETSRLDAKKTQFDIEHMRLVTAKTQMDNEKIILLIEYKRLVDIQEPQSHEYKAQSNAYKEQLFKENSIIQSNEDTDTLIKSQIENVKLRIASKNAQIETTTLRIASEQAQFDTDRANYVAAKVRLDYHKSRLESAKSILDTNKSLYESEKAQFDTDNANYLADKANYLAEKDILDTNKSLFASEKAQFDTDNANYLAEKSILDTNTTHVEYEKAQLETNKSRFNAEKGRLDTNKSRFESEKATFYADNAIYLAEKAILDTNKSRLDAEITNNKIVATTNISHENYTIYSPTKMERIDIEKTQADALVAVQRSQIIKMIQLLSVETRKIVDELYCNKSVISITNIYQKTYNNDKYASGFGDFIRGCYFMLDFCETFHFKPIILINHPLNEFLENHSSTNNYNILKKVSMFDDNNCNKHILNNDNVIINTIRKNETINRFINYLDTSQIDNNNNINIYNIVFPYLEVSFEHQKIMRNILKPSQEMKEYIVYTLENLELTEKNYIIIHIRSGDNYLNCVDTQFNLTYLTDITNSIILLLDQHPNAYFLLIADNKFIKLYLYSQKLYRLYIIFNEIGHFGENTQLDRNQIKNTMLDFYLFAHSSIIYAFSAYDHGSGFSWWCAKTYGIPYSCKIIKP